MAAPNAEGLIQPSDLNNTLCCQAAAIANANADAPTSRGMSRSLRLKGPRGQESLLYRANSQPPLAARQPSASSSFRRKRALSSRSSLEGDPINTGAGRVKLLLSSSGQTRKSVRKKSRQASHDLWCWQPSVSDSARKSKARLLLQVLSQRRPCSC